MVGVAIVLIVKANKVAPVTVRTDPRKFGTNTDDIFKTERYLYFNGKPLGGTAEDPAYG